MSGPSGGNDGKPGLVMMVKDLLTGAFLRREALFHDKDTDCFRLFNGAGDGMDGLAIDRYGDYLLVQYYTEQAGVMIEGNTLNPEVILESLLPLTADIRGILVKNRLVVTDDAEFDLLRKSTLMYGTEPPGDFTVRQNGITAAADLVGGQSTGIFLDMREVRADLEGLYNERHPENMLNLFCYTALFSVHGLVHGVRHAVNVDLSRGVLERARINYGLNGLECDDRDFIYGDALQWTRRFARDGRRFSLVVTDPPTFARNRKKTFSVRRHYREMLLDVARIAPDGYALTAVNSSGVTEEEYRNYHPRGWKLLSLRHESSDFPALQTHYLKVGLWHVRGEMS